MSGALSLPSFVHPHRHDHRRRRPSIPLSKGSLLHFAGTKTVSPSIRTRPIEVKVLSCRVGEVPPVEFVDDRPSSVELEPIDTEEKFDRVVAGAQQVEESVVFVWMASWCRKCIYLKPKLERLAADYHPRIRFYHVDVNLVPQRLVSRAEVTKMPMIQLWKDGKKQGEVIGGYKSWLVINDVREMIENMP
ncbi:hypothetical protein QJS10_CPA10g01903 [Acorus calamus]|uniref:Thioredoxin domain-containing protein n=1 Tax=Acorus calamus TaxID=4465 RepID=A0AAV9E691_ACOCL|nr:hypothetical protein QJS10_CPA10g01903 [Acorus calamus]